MVGGRGFDKFDEFDSGGSLSGGGGGGGGRYGVGTRVGYLLFSPPVTVEKYPDSDAVVAVFVIGTTGGQGGRVLLPNLALSVLL